MSESSMRAALADYLAVRRALGFKLARNELLLEQFIGFCEQAATSPSMKNAAPTTVFIAPSSGQDTVGPC